MLAIKATIHEIQKYFHPHFVQLQQDSMQGNLESNIYF
jgi:hypothetical protein